ncbi:hypothetical protein CSUI_001243 [Cystoisospora suis]|uniref:Transmembrane protein n=1 Tax=Cystoisospora suis TaxID=483139 RepID=A0A2C6KLH5_9APIC|nr:hypothetical protein CSUI_001243 [Cystoisospora suis]
MSLAVASLGSLVAAASVSAVLPPAGIDTHGAGVALVHILFLEAGRAVYSFCRSRAVCRKLVPLSVEVSQWKAAATQNRPSSRFAEEVTTGSSSSSLRLFQAGNAAGLGFYVPVIITSVFPVWSGPAACCAAVTTLGPASAVDAFTVGEPFSCRGCARIQAEARMSQHCWLLWTPFLRVAGLAVGTICIFNVFATLLVQKFFLRHATFKKHLCVLGATVVLHVIISSVAARIY